MFSDRLKRSVSTLALIGGLCAVGSAHAAFVAYHDFGEIGSALPGNLSTHTVGSAGDTTANTNAGAVQLVQFSDGAGTGVFVTVTGSNGTDLRNTNVIDPPTGGSPADALFNGVGLGFDAGLLYEGGNNGADGMTITLTGLDPTRLYDLAFVGGRNIPADNPDRFTLGGVDGTPTNISSSGIVSAFVTEQETRDNPVPSGVIRWQNIDPGADGTITVAVEPELVANANVAYIAALRLEEAVPEPSSLAFLGLGGLLIARRRRSS